LLDSGDWGQLRGFGPEGLQNPIPPSAAARWWARNLSASGAWGMHALAGFYNVYVLPSVRTMDVEVSLRALVNEADAAVGHADCYLQDRDE